jgi:lipopolysaccharide/colanic/teichoic acid biosynthesis glycosyltransferase
MEWLDILPGGPAHSRFTVRPGLTGSAQVAGRNSVLWSRRLELDAEFASNYSPILYAYLIFKTPVALMKPTVSADRNSNLVNDLGQG